MNILSFSGSLLDTIPETMERRKSGDLSRFRSGVDLLAGHREKPSLVTVKSGVRRLFPRRSITTIPEDLQIQSQD